MNNNSEIGGVNKVSKKCSWRLKNLVANMKYADKVIYPSPWFVIIQFGKTVYSIPRSAIKLYSNKSLTEREKEIRRS